MLFITLPSGRKLAYVKPKIGTNKFGGQCITYEGVGGTKKWERLDSYGPKFVENIVQATARDILCYAMQTLRCCSIVMHIHDEVVIEADPRMSLDEPCLFGWTKSGKHQWYTGRKETTIWEFDKPKKNGDHPTMKPIPLLAYPIMNSSMTNSLVLDPFGGSGSTLIACEQTSRICHTIELDEKFCDVIVKRYIEQVGSSAKVSVIRDGLTYSYDEIAPEAEDATLL